MAEQEAESTASAEADVWTPPTRRLTSGGVSGRSQVPASRTSAPLVAAASTWVNEAMNAWSDDDPVKVAALAPMAVEFLGKAVLWNRNPTLLLPLSNNAEASLIILATQPDLSNPLLRTIGLQEVLRRTGHLLGGLPLDPKQTTRMVSVRNGAMHVGAASDARDVLLDALAVGEVYLDAIKHDPSRFYAEHASSVKALLDAKTSEVGHRVTAKRARARLKLAELEERLGDMFTDTTAQLEERALYDLDPRNYGVDYWGVNANCPECGSTGRLFGRVDADIDVEYDYQPTDGIEHGTAAITGFNWEIYPQVFACNVCRLNLNGPDELNESGLPASRHTVEEDDIGPDFDPRIAFSYDDHHTMYA